jgi:hypothetical protein
MGYEPQLADVHTRGSIVGRRTNMKVWIALLITSCVGADDPEIATKQQDERINVQGCRPGTHEVDVGDTWRCISDTPWWNPAPGDVGGRERIPGGGRGGGGGDNGVHHGGLAGSPVMGQPGVTLYEFPLGTVVCKFVCASLSLLICDAVRAACLVGSVYTLGGLVIPCASVITTACLAGILPAVACSEVICPK